MRALQVRLTIATACGALMLAAAAMSCGDGAGRGVYASPDATSDDAAPDGDDGGALLCFGLPCDAPASTPYVPCAATPPAVGSACTTEGEVCEYGTSWWFECNLALRCQQNRWVDEMNHCYWDGAAGGPCPATWAEAVAMDASTSCPLDCQYPEGHCNCAVACGSGGQRHVTSAGSFACTPIPPGCPSPRPLSGTPCAEAGALCVEGACGCGQILACTQGVWQASPTPPCP